MRRVAMHAKERLVLFALKAAGDRHGAREQMTF
jgi:hypothetical protein